VKVKYFGPLAIKNAKKFLPDIAYYKNDYDVTDGSHILVMATGWNQFRNLDLLKIKELLKTSILIYLRNIYKPEKVNKLGFVYEGVGRW
jgi:UDPglucose 6-dehydrogenase